MNTKTGDAPYQYDAFVSYNRNADKKVAPALRMGLHQFARPWYRLRAARVFLDDSTLPADSELWEPIERAMNSSQYLIVLASPEAAGSEGVDHELRYWLAHRPHDRILIGLTAGSLSPEQRVDPTTNALPPALTTWFARGPRYIDLRWMRDARDLSLRDGRFQDAVAEFAAKVRGVPKDRLHGADVRQHRNAIRLRNAAIGVLVLLLGLVGIGFDNAIAERNVAQSRALAIEAEQLRSIDPAISRQLSVAAYAIAPTEEARSSLLSTASLWPVTRKFDHDGPTFGLAVSKQAGLVASAGADGSVSLWSSATPTSPERLASVLVEQNLVTSAALTADGTVLAAGTADGMVGLWDVAAPRTPRSLGPLLRVGPARITALAFDPEGHILVIGGSDGTLRAWDVSAPGTPRPLGAPVAGHVRGVRAVDVSADGSTVATGGTTRPCGCGSSIRGWACGPQEQSPGTTPP